MRFLPVFTALSAMLPLARSLPADVEVPSKDPSVYMEPGVPLKSINLPQGAPGLGTCNLSMKRYGDECEEGSWGALACVGDLWFSNIVSLCNAWEA